jgi:hypothetical protein
VSVAPGGTCSYFDLARSYRVGFPGPRVARVESRIRSRIPSSPPTISACVISFGVGKPNVLECLVRKDSILATDDLALLSLVRTSKARARSHSGVGLEVWFFAIGLAPRVVGGVTRMG